MLQLLMAAYAGGRKNEPAAKPLILVFILGAVWAFGYGMEMQSNLLSTKVFWMKVYWTAASFGPLGFLLIVMEHLEMTPTIKIWHRWVLLIPSLMLTALIWTIPHHDLLLYDFSIQQTGTLRILDKKTGILYNPIFVILQGISLVSYYFLIRSLRSASHIKRRQSITILVALFIPFLVNIPTILNMESASWFDFTPHALVLSSGLFAYAIFRYRWLDILPLARNTLVETIPVGVIVLDAKNRIMDINPFAKQLLGVEDAVIGLEGRKVFANFDGILHGEPSLETIQKELKVNETMGDLHHIAVQKIPLSNRDGLFNGCILTLQDITERKQANERLQAQLDEIESLHNQLREQAIRDPLTGLFNRRYMSEVLEYEMRRAERNQHTLGVLMIEIDNFKSFNDTHGHEVGDVTLKKLAELIQTVTRSNDIPCRFGGDEFILVLPEATLQTARHCAERLRQSAADLNLEYEGKALQKLHLSIGVAVFPQHGSNMSLVIRAADEAMYRAKRAGKNRVVVAEDYDTLISA